MHNMEKLFEPCHEIMALFILRKLILQTRMRNHPVGLDVWFLVGPYIYFHTSCVQTTKALVRRCGCAGSPEPSLVAGRLCDKYHIFFHFFSNPFYHTLLVPVPGLSSSSSSRNSRFGYGIGKPSNTLEYTKIIIFTKNNFFILFYSYFT